MSYSGVDLPYPKFSPEKYQKSNFYNKKISQSEIKQLCDEELQKIVKPNDLDTTYITLVGGPGTGKTTISSLLYAELKLLNKNVDEIPEIVRDFIFENRVDELNDQYHISQLQYKKFLSRLGKVEYVVSDTSLLNGIYYNNNNINNVSDREKTFKSIMHWFFMFNNIVIYIKRGRHYEYDSAGRVHCLEEAMHADRYLLEFLKANKIDYIEFESTTNVKKDIEILAKSIIETVNRTKSKVEFN